MDKAEKFIIFYPVSHSEIFLHPYGSQNSL